MHQFSACQMLQRHQLYPRYKRQIPISLGPRRARTLILPQRLQQHHHYRRRELLGLQYFQMRNPNEPHSKKALYAAWKALGEVGKKVRPNITPSTPPLLTHKLIAIQDAQQEVIKVSCSIYHISTS
jgi:hypothetical protein